MRKSQHLTKRDIHSRGGDGRNHKAFEVLHASLFPSLLSCNLNPSSQIWTRHLDLQSPAG
jgi:hypothetical protein